jgi:serine/threonine protein kinase
MYTNAAHRSQVGSPYWMSPEIMRHSEYTFKTDIWSLGVTAIELAEGVVPNSHLKPLMVLFQLRDKPIQGFKEPQRWSPEFNAFVKECLNTSPNLRPEAKTLLKHEFIVKNSRGQRLLAELVQNSLSDIE